MKILINGCSHTAMNYIHWFDKEKTILNQPVLRPSWVSFLQEKLKIKEYGNIYTNPNTYEDFPSEYDGAFKNITTNKYLDLIKDSSFILSLATDGKGNDSILFDTLSTLRYCKKKNIEIDYVCVQWSGHSRRLVTSDKNDLDFANPHENYQFGVNLEPSGSYITLQYMILLQDYLNENNICYNFINYFPMDRKAIINNRNLYRELDTSKFISYKKYHPVKDGWLDKIKNDNLAIDNDGHPGKELMEIISDKVYKKIQKYNKNVI